MEKLFCIHWAEDIRAVSTMELGIVSSKGKSPPNVTDYSGTWFTEYHCRDSECEEIAVNGNASEVGLSFYIKNAVANCFACAAHMKFANFPWIKHFVGE